ncbi:MAG: DUF5711 family protein [Eubacterium sp.]
MPSHERENARKEKQRKTDAKIKKIIWAVLIAVIIALIVMKVCEIDFQTIKNYFVDSDGNLSILMTADEDAYPFTIDSSKNVHLYSLNDKLGVLTDSSMTVLNPSDADVLYTFNHGYANPIIKCSGTYYCLVDQGANRLRLDTVNDNVYETKTENTILTADVSKNGTVIYATKSNDAKSTVFVYSKALKKQMELEVNSGYIVSVAIDSSGKKCAYAVVNSKDAKIVTTVYTINVGDDKERAAFDFVDSNLMDLHYSNSGDLYFVGTDCVSVITSQKKQKEVFKKGSANTVCFSYTSDNELVYVYSDYSESIDSTVAHINSSGKIKNSFKINQKTKYVSSSSNEICVLFSDRVEVYSLTKGDLKNTYKCDDSVGTVRKMSSKVFINRQQLVDVLE